MKKVLVTGGNGLIGKICVKKLLEEDFEVHATTRNTHNLSQDVIWHQADLFDYDAVEKIFKAETFTHLIHFAWITDRNLFWTSHENLKWIEATSFLLNMFGKTGGKRAVGVGTMAEYDWTEGGICHELKSPLLPHTIYGKCKLATSKNFSAIASIYGFSFAWGRLFFPYGPGEPSNKFISAIIQAIRLLKTIPCSHGRQVRDFLHINDIAEALIVLLKSHEQGDFNIASGQPLSLREISSLITQEMGHSDLIEFDAIPAQKGEPLVLIADMKRFYEIFRWRPKIDIKEGIQQMIDESQTN